MASACKAESRDSLVQIQPAPPNMNVFENVDLSVSKKQGNLGVARAIYEYARLGYTVLVPLSDSDKYDIVIDTGTQLQRVQCKTSTYRTVYRSRGVKYVSESSFDVNLTTSGGNTTQNTRRVRQNGDYDLLFVLTQDGRCWSIPENAIEGVTSIVVGGKKYNEFAIN